MHRLTSCSVLVLSDCYALLHNMPCNSLSLYFSAGTTVGCVSLSVNMSRTCALRAHNKCDDSRRELTVLSR